jgi:hypothetical protein
MRMITSVNERGRSIATFRYICVWAMETTARWTPITPEMEAKVMMGRHIWEFAQMADALGKRTFELRLRTFELRLPEQHSIPPVAEYDAFLKEVVKTGTTADRTAAFYDGVLPGLLARFKGYIAATDEILDEPSIIILQRAIVDLERQRIDAAQLQRELKLSSGAAAGVAAREKAFPAIVAEEKVAA